MSRNRVAKSTVGRTRLKAMIEDATVDAYGKSEQRGGFLCLIEENLETPFETELLGIPVIVERIDLTDDETIVALCRKGQHRQTIPLLDLPVPMLLPTGWEWIEAYRTWCRGQW